MDFVGTPDRYGSNGLQKEAATNNSNYHRRVVQVQAWLSKSSPTYAGRDEYDDSVCSNVTSQVQVLRREQTKSRSSRREYTVRGRIAFDLNLSQKGNGKEKMPL
jgi:hypothetical protein